MERLNKRNRRALKAAAIPAALVASALVVWQGSYAAFSATTNNASNAWAAGKVLLVDDDAGAAAFTVAGIKPGSTGAKCILVTSNGTLPGSVKMYLANVSTTNALSGSLNMQVEEGTGGTFASCATFVPSATIMNTNLAAAALANTNFASGVGTFPLVGVVGETKSYRITWTLSAAAPSTVMSGTAAADFVWEAQNS